MQGRSDWINLRRSIKKINYMLEDLHENLESYSLVTIRNKLLKISTSSKFSFGIINKFVETFTSNRPYCNNCNGKNIRVRYDKSIFCMTCGYDSQKKSHSKTSAKPTSRKREGT